MDQSSTYQKLVDEWLKEDAANSSKSTRRAESKEVRDRQSIEKTALFAYRYGTSTPIGSLYVGELHALESFRFVIDDPVYDLIYKSTVYSHKPKDFAKAKTGKERLEARLTKKKGKPSSLLSKLVNKT